MSQLMMGTHIENGKARSVEMAVDAQGRLKKSTSEIEVLELSVPQAGITVVAIIPVSGYSRLFLQAQVAGQALAEFVVSARPTKNAPFSVLYSTPADYLSPRGLLVGTSGDLTNQAAGTVGDLQMDVAGLYELKIEAAAAHVAGSVVSLFGSVT